MRELVIVGAGGHGRETLDIVEAINAVEPTWAFAGFVDDGEIIADRLERRDASLLGTTEILADTDRATSSALAHLRSEQSSMSNSPPGDASQRPDPPSRDRGIRQSHRRRCAARCRCSGHHQRHPRSPRAPQRQRRGVPRLCRRRLHDLVARLASQRRRADRNRGLPGHRSDHHSRGSRSATTRSSALAPLSSTMCHRV